MAPIATIVHRTVIGEESRPKQGNVKEGKIVFNGCCPNSLWLKIYYLCIYLYSQILMMILVVMMIVVENHIPYRCHDSVNPVLQTDRFIFLNIARGTTDPGNQVHNLRNLFQPKLC